MKYHKPHTADQTTAQNTFKQPLDRRSTSYLFFEVGNLRKIMQHINIWASLRKQIYTFLLFWISDKTKPIKLPQDLSFYIYSLSNTT